ncbi:MAG: hypothetical protein JWM27_1651 [Gemmatimonadetes bacterium]|nr:hypothetical protein [Gemmatimonadota bacterium]
MHTEHLQNVRPTWVAFGWFLSAAATALAIFALIGIGVLRPDPEGGSGGWMLLAFAAGFFLGGWFTGARAGAAPILHAVGIGLFSLVVWLLVNLVFGSTTGAAEWRSMPATLTAGLLLLQMVAAALGARLGSREARVAAR